MEPKNVFIDICGYRVKADNIREYGTYTEIVLYEKSFRETKLYSKGFFSQIKEALSKDKYEWDGKWHVLAKNQLYIDDILGGKYPQGLLRAVPEGNRTRYEDSVWNKENTKILHERIFYYEDNQGEVFRVLEKDADIDAIMKRIDEAMIVIK